MHVDRQTYKIAFIVFIQIAQHFKLVLGKCSRTCRKQNEIQVLLWFFSTNQNSWKIR